MVFKMCPGDFSLQSFDLWFEGAKPNEILFPRLWILQSPRITDLVLQSPTLMSATFQLRPSQAATTTTIEYKQIVKPEAVGLR